jgi:hypothetical protein
MSGSEVGVFTHLINMLQGQGNLQNIFLLDEMDMGFVVTAI